MQVKSVAIKPSDSAKENGVIEMTPEQLAASCARISRKNEDIETIYKIIQDSPSEEESLNRVFKVIDYGHASIGGLTSGIPVVIHGCSLWLAFRLFQWLQVGDGQESSTRYISYSNPDTFCDYHDLGFTDLQIETLLPLHKRCVEMYEQELTLLNKLADEHPELVRYPEKATESVRKRIRLNFGFDRARSFLPTTLRTTIAITCTARVWTDLLSALLSSPQKECGILAEHLKRELGYHIPKFLKHGRRKAGWVADIEHDLHTACNNAFDPWCNSEVIVSLAQFAPRTLITGKTPRENRYDRFSSYQRREAVYVLWPKIGLAEMRDLNRHRPGAREFVATHTGFYLCSEIERTPEINTLVEEVERILKMMARGQDPNFWYTLLLGSEGYGWISTQLHQLIYLIELRTGPGCHFRYVELVKEAAEKLFGLLPGLRDQVLVGEGEPE